MAGNQSMFRSGPSWADRWAAIAGEASVAHLSAAETGAPSRQQGASPPSRSLRGSTQRRHRSVGTGIPTSVQEDLEDFLNRFDSHSSAHGRGSSGNASSAPATVPTVVRFEPEDLQRLTRLRHGKHAIDWAKRLGDVYRAHNPSKLDQIDQLLHKYRGREQWLYQQVISKYEVAREGSALSLQNSAETADEEDKSDDCPICLTAFREGEILFQLPCGARHKFHEHCISKWLSKSVMCPLCRVDVKELLPAETSTSNLRNTVGRRGAGPRTKQVRRNSSLAGERLGHAGLGRTAGGGIVLRYERAPPPEWERPAYIPSHVRHLAQYLEVSYPGRGAARIWRVPNGTSAGDLSNAMPIEDVG